ncbi:MAG: GGDEF domain-containing phosphodiesterase [Lachnospiraceae bacterium]|nr:GGDEF domain-containing phosphodiesterase [Lachnospiraceae bacterium]
MVDSPDIGRKISSSFADRMEGGAFVFGADDEQKLVYVNDNLIRLFECKDADDLLAHVGGRLEGMIHDPAPSIILNEISRQVEESKNGSGYVFYNIKTKKGDVLRVVNHWTLVHDDDLGDVFYATIYLHRLDNAANDFDIVTGLLGKRKFDRYAAGINRQFIEENDKMTFAVIYVNLVNFKLLNLERGVNEGNACLRKVAKVLGSVYGNAFVSRLSDDHFAVFTEYESSIDRTEQAIRTFAEDYGNRYNVILKFGIYRFEPGPDFYVETALSRAKMACDTVKKADKTDYAEYSSELAERVKTTEYVVGKIDEAIKNEWIRIYYQPVVRSLTGNACSMESLVRWIDPEIGFLAPDKFIGVLEEERCIYKLDCYVVEKVCRTIGERLKEGLPTVPASVNFSRVDFIMCDMLGVVEEAVKKHGVPREYLHIEITESMISSDEELMRKVIDDFRAAGYEIWMDDFGSGYSSLTLLKDYDFNTLKLDMRFLTPLTDKSKSIIKSVVTMAKDIGMKTLAEGVETKEQLDFLREIGCGLIQGYYYGRPEPVEDVFGHLEERGIDVEPSEWRDFYQAASFNARATDVPLELIEDDGTDFKTLFMNKSYKDQIFTEEYNLETIDRLIYHTSSPLIKKYREFANIAEMSKQEETFYYTLGGSFISITVKEIAEHNGHHILTGMLLNLSKDAKSEAREKLDSVLKQVNLLFTSVQTVNLSENTIFPLLGGFKYLDRDAVDGNDLQKGIRYFANKMVHPSEAGRCLKFFESATLEERVEGTGRGYIGDVFRIMSPEGYKRCEAFILMIPGTRGNEYLFCVKECVA